jgi:hypothetical protein
MTITLCNNTQCPIRHQCYRGTAKRSARVKVQRFACYQVSGTNIVKCDNFLPPRRAS